MPYTYREAIKTAYKYLQIDESQVEVIDKTNGRGIVYEFSGVKTVIFIYPISCKQNNKQNFFDTRDSGAKERIITWKYALDNKLRYFCFGFNEEQDRYKDYVLSLESDEQSISNISFRKSEFSESTGTQVNIPNDFIPTGKFVRTLTPKGFYISAVRKDYILDYICMFDNRPYQNTDVNIDISDMFEEEEKDQEEEMSKKNMEHLKNCLEVLRKPRQHKEYPIDFIIYGAPGTGKTYSTAEYALAIIENRPVDLTYKSNIERVKTMIAYNQLIKEGRIVFTTFHQSYGYEEFIQGLRPVSSSEKMTFDVVDGVFKRIADRALNDQENNYVIIIDEINRANISKVFGELITLIEEDKRWGELNQLCATLQSGDVFAVPNNLYIVGTMNSADKSISLIDAALRRRFEFVEQKPQPELVNDIKLRKVLISLNNSLADELESSDLLIGHSYFMNRTIDDLESILNNNIIPLLYEYFYDNKKKVASVLGKAIEGTSVKVVDDKLGRLSVKADKE